MPRLLSCLGGALLLSWVTPAAAAPDATPVASARWTDAAPAIDGRLDEDAWASARSHGGFVERKPRLRDGPPVETTFKVLYDGDALYIGVAMADAQAPVGRTRTRDSFTLFRDDAISVKLDPALDHRTTLGFAVNAAGARLDYRGIDESEFKVGFDAVWEGAAAVTEGGWSVEFRLPWAALGVDPRRPPVAMGLNLSRDHSRRNATYDWALMAPPLSPIAASRYGQLVGFEDLAARTAGRPAGEGGAAAGGWHVTPYALGGFQRDASGPNARTEGIINGGLDAAGPLADGWRAQLTVNTDFAQVDVDDQVVNLSRFGLFLEEKRDFFLRDLEVFAFGRPGEAQLLHTRRIGLVDGAEIPLLGGVKLVGQPHERLRVGLLQVTTRPGAAEPWTSHVVGRGLWEVGQGSNVGVMVTSRQSLEGRRDDNLVLGLDGAWRSRTTPLLLSAFTLVSMTDGDAGAPGPATGGGGTGRGANVPAGGVGLTAYWRGELLRPRLDYAFYDRELRADLGFFQRVGVHQGSASVEVEPRIGRHGLEKLTVAVQSDAVADDAAREVLDWGVAGTAELVWEAGYRVGVGAHRRSERLRQGFDAGGVTPIAPGRYTTTEVDLSLALPSPWPVSASADLTWRDYFGGTLWGVEAALTARPTALVRLELGGQISRVSFPDAARDFTAALLNGRLALGFTPALGLDLFAGWSHLADLLRLQSRLRWTWHPGSDLFVVYALDLEASSARERFQSLLVKATWRWP